MKPVALPPTARPRARAPYENWRPPITGVTVLALVGVTSLVLPRLPGDTWALPTGSVEEGRSPEEAAQAVLTPLSGTLPVARRSQPGPARPGPARTDGAGGERGERAGRRRVPVGQAVGISTVSMM